MHRRFESHFTFIRSIGSKTISKAYVVGTFDTKADELNYIAGLIERAGVQVMRVDLGTRSDGQGADIGPEVVAGYHPEGASAVLGKQDRGQAVKAMATAFERMAAGGLVDCGGIIGAGGSGATALVTPAMRALPVGTPKIMVSTVASGDVRAYVGPSDIMMMYAVTDVQGLNRISRQVLGNAANALAGMINNSIAIDPSSDKPAIGLTMFGVTTTCVQMVTRALENRYDCLVFHATGTGGQSMEKLVQSGLIAGVLDLTTTEIADLVGGGVFSAGESRLDVFAEHLVPYVGSCGALDMVNFGARESVKGFLTHRKLHAHNPQVTLMRTDVAENRRIGAFIAKKLNAMAGPVRFLLPEGGVSMIDAPSQVFHDPEADQALFETIERNFKPTDNRQLIRLPYHINSQEFAEAAVAQFLSIADQEPN